MTTHHLEDDEEAPLWDALKAAGAYLDSLEVHDLRYLTRDQLLLFGSIVIARYAEQRAEWFDNRRHPDDRIGGRIEELDDEIPF